MGYDEEVLEAEPLREALERLREMVGSSGSEADVELEHRMRELRLTVAAITELVERGEEAPTPEQTRSEMNRLRLDFVFDPAALLELASGARDAGDDEDADTLERAYRWHEARFGASSR